MAQSAETQPATPSSSEIGAVVSRERVRRTRWSQIWYLIRRWPLFPLSIIVILLFAGIFPDFVAPADPIQQRIGFSSYPPTWGAARPEFNTVPKREDFPEGTRGTTDYNRAVQNSFEQSKYILGADRFGRDVLSRVVFGARISLQVVGWALASGIIIGTILGLVSGYYGGWIDEILMRIVDIWLALPFILIALVVAVALGKQTVGVVILLVAMLAWTPFVRQVRADVLGIKSRDYILAARISGASDIRIMWKHVLPGTFSTVLVVASLRVGQLILAESILSFLGAGIPDPIPAWGKSVNDGRAHIELAWWISFFPGLAIFLVVMSMNFFGDWLRDRLDPRLRQLD